MSVFSQLSEKSLLKHDNLFRAVFDASSNLMAIVRQDDGVCLEVNDAWLEHLGYSREEVIGRTAQEFGLWAEPSVRAGILRRLGNKGEITSGEAVLRGKDGQLHDCLVTARALRFEQEDLVLFSSQEVVSDGSSEQPVRTSKALLLDAIESINEGFVLYGSDGRLIICNSKFKEFYSYSDEDVMPGVNGRDLGLLDIDRDAVIVEQHQIKNYVNRREDLGVGPPESFVVTLRDGRILLLSDRRTDSGGVVSIQRDITDLKRAEAAISAAKDEAMKANRAKSEFLAHMSHELRTPLNSILGFTQIMKEQVFGSLGDSKYLDYATNVHHSGQHLLALINDVLDISKVEAGEVTLEETTFDLRQAIRSCIQMVTGQAGVSDDRIEFEDAQDVQFFKGDERIIKQVVLNLLSNSSKFTPTDRRITVSTTLDPDGCVVVSVVDEGCGIASENIPKVLEPFGQVRSGAHHAHPGTGLGLSLSKMLTELHRGTLEIESKVEKGTKVTLHFPLERTVIA